MNSIEIGDIEKLFIYDKNIKILNANNKLKIDNVVHIAHNVTIDENSFIIANAMIAGSVKIGKNCWVAPSANVLNGITLEDDPFVGILSLIDKNTESKKTYVGIPAKPLNKK